MNIKAERYNNTEFITFEHYCTEDPVCDVYVNEDFSDKKVLDLGAGFGQYLENYPKVWKELALLDPSKTLLDEARKKAGELNLTNVSFIEGKGEQIPFADEHFDTIICCHALCEYDDWKQGLNEILRVLKPGGTFLFVDATGGSKDSLAEIEHIGDVHEGRRLGKQNTDIWAHLPGFINTHFNLLDHQTFMLHYVFNTLEEAEKALEAEEPRMKTCGNTRNSIRHYLKTCELDGKIMLDLETMYLKMRKQ